MIRYIDTSILVAYYLPERLSEYAERSPPLRTLDALHLAVAAGAGASLLTVDVQLARAARKLHVACRLLR